MQKLINLLRILKCNFNVNNSLNEYIKLNKNLYRDKKCLIIGNGPSLNIDDLARVNKEIFTFAFNKIYLLENKLNWFPNFYMVDDSLVYNQNTSDIQNYLNFLPNSSTAFFPFHFHDKFKGNIYRFNYVNPISLYKPMFSLNPHKRIYSGQTVTFSALQLLISLGFKKIYFIGMDFKFEIPANKISEGVYLNKTEINHFSKDYRKMGEKWNYPNLDKQAKSFLYAKEFLKKIDQEISIVNCTRGGNFNIFPRSNIDVLF